MVWYRSHLGISYLIVHRKQIFQIRVATEEEKTLLKTPEIELLGIKDR